MYAVNLVVDLFVTALLLRFQYYGLMFLGYVLDEGGLIVGITQDIQSARLLTGLVSRLTVVARSRSMVYARSPLRVRIFAKDRSSPC